MTGKTLVDEMLETVVAQADPQALELRQAWLDWEAKLLGIRMQMLRGQIDEQTASLMAEQASREYSDTERRIASRLST
jgi:hypothetical protein